MKQIVKMAFDRLGFEIHRKTAVDRFPTDRIGMELTLSGLVRRGFQPAQIVDVGAARGDWTKLALQYWPTSRCHMIEPLSNHKASLEAVVSRNPKASYMLTACGDKDCDQEIGVSPDLLGTSFHQAGLEKRRIPVVTLDTLLEKQVIQQPDLIKMDIQGHEYWAILGAAKCLQKCRLVLLECIMHPFNPSMKLLADLIVLMKNHGFIPYEIVDTLRRAHSGAMGQCDLLLAREGDPLVDNKHFYYPETGTLFAN